VVKEVEVIVITADHTLIRLDDAVIRPVIKIREMSGKTEIDAKKRLFCLSDSPVEKVNGLNLIPPDIAAKGVLFLPCFKV
jgi:hypothetical protein